MGSKLPVILSLIFVLIIMNSCYTSVVMISILQPAEVSLPGNIKSISIYPVTGIPAPPGVFDSIRNVSINQAFDYNLTRRGYIYGLYEALDASPRFRKVMVSDSSFVDSLYQGILGWNVLKKICQFDSTDAVLLILKAIAYDTVNYLEESGVTYSLSDPAYYQEQYENNSCTLVLRMISKFKLAFYEPLLEKKSAQLSCSDTVTLYKLNSCEDVFSADSMRDMLYNACFFTGEKLGKRLAPTWNDEVRRIFYKGSDIDFREAAWLVKQNRWTEAGQIWEALSSSRNKRIANKAAFNMALAWEQEDDLNQALLWLDYADSLMTRHQTTEYRKILERRLDTKQLLDLQMISE
jgi:hypothetical protein